MRTRLLVVSGFPQSIRAQLPKLGAVNPHHDLTGLRIRLLGTPLSFGWNRCRPRAPATHPPHTRHTHPPHATATRNCHT